MLTNSINLHIYLGESYHSLHFGEETEAQEREVRFLRSLGCCSASAGRRSAWLQSLCSVGSLPPKGWLLWPFYRGGNWGPERKKYLPKHGRPVSKSHDLNPNLWLLAQIGSMTKTLCPLSGIMECSKSKNNQESDLWMKAWKPESISEFRRRGKGDREGRQEEGGSSVWSWELTCFRHWHYLYRPELDERRWHSNDNH